MKLPHHLAHLRDTGVSKQLIVHGKPFLVLGGECQNSSFSCPEYMTTVWPKLKSAHLNTVLGSVSWEQVEPVEGYFDFKVLDQVLLQARTNGFHLVLIWFGAFKNGLSSYAPPWVKLDSNRFPRTKLRNKHEELKTSDILSLFGSEICDSDAKAFVKFMDHLKTVDRDHGTVIMVQVENEVGVLGSSRDYSLQAEEVASLPVPEDLVGLLKRDWSTKHPNFLQKYSFLRQIVETAKPGALTWQELQVDTPYGGQLFMAYHYAKYVERVSSRGKACYPLPMYTNVWQNYNNDEADHSTPVVAGGGNLPGDYPSGGAIPDVLDIWLAFAPSLDFIAPDIYLNDYSKTCASYRYLNQPLFIPEQRRDEYGALRIWPAFGSFQCLGTAPFGIDSIDLQDNPFRKHYGLLSKVSSYVLSAQAQIGCSVGFFFDNILDNGKDSSPELSITFGQWKLTVQRSFVFGKPSAGSGMIIQLEDDEFLFLGWGFQVIFASTDPLASFTGILSFVEKDIDPLTGELRSLRLLNGDETRSGQFAIMPSEDPDYGGFPISVTIPAGTGIATCKPYILRD